MDDKKAKRMAAGILKVGETKIFIQPEERTKLKEAMTKEDVRQLIKDRVIAKRKDNEQSKARARLLAEKKKKGRKRGHGKRTGKKTARKGKKEIWIKNVRAQRRTLKEIKASGVTLKESARKIYLMIKGGHFKGKKYIEAFVEKERKK